MVWCVNYVMYRCDDCVKQCHGYKEDWFVDENHHLQMMWQIVVCEWPVTIATWETCFDLSIDCDGIDCIICSKHLWCSLCRKSKELSFVQFKRSCKTHNYQLLNGWQCWRLSQFECSWTACIIGCIYNVLLCTSAAAQLRGLILCSCFLALNLHRLRWCDHRNQRDRQPCATNHFTSRHRCQMIDWEFEKWRGPKSSCFLLFRVFMFVFIEWTYGMISIVNDDSYIAMMHGCHTIESSMNLEAANVVWLNS